MTARRDARRAVVGRELLERDDRSDLDLGMRLRQVYPDELVAMEQLLLAAGPAIEDLGDVQSVVGTARQENRIADGEQRRVDQHLFECRRNKARIRL